MICYHEMFPFFFFEKFTRFCVLLNSDICFRIFIYTLAHIFLLLFVSISCQIIKEDVSYTSNLADFTYFIYIFFQEEVYKV